MKPWEIWDGPLFGGHRCVIVSNPKRVDRKQKVVVLKCTSLRPDTRYQADEHHTTLDRKDGLEGVTRCECDLFYTIEKSALTRCRGIVCPVRQRDISRKTIQGLALAGL